MSYIKENLSNLFPLSHKKIYYGLILGFILKSVGASWDASYHFKHFRELYQLPHIVNAVGAFLILGLVAYVWFREPKGDHSKLKIILYGSLVFIAGGAFDQWSHETYGVDLTAWSASHFVLNIGTFIAMTGAFLYVFNDYYNSHLQIKIKKILGFIFAWLMLDSFWFPLLQHEQGAVVDYAMKHGIRLADPDLIEMFFRTQHDVYSSLPGWLYGAWVVFACVVMFQFVKRMDLQKYGATIVATFYVLERLVMNIIFSWVNYPLSVLPFYLIVIAFIFDIVYNKLYKKPEVRDIITSLIPIIIILGFGLLNPETPIHPPIPIISTFLWAIPAAVLGYILGNGIYLFFKKHLQEKV